MKSQQFIPLLFCALVVGCSPEPSSEALQAKAAMTITTATVETRKIPQTLELQGEIAPWHEAVISTRVTGIPLAAIKTEVGDIVKRGQLLAQLDDRTIRADLANARANLAQARADAAQAVASSNRALKLKEKRLISDQDVEVAQTQADAAEARVLMAQAQVDIQDILLKDCEIRAVDDGVISARSATLGQVPQAGGELFRLIRQQRLEWRAELKPKQLALIRPGQTAQVTLADGGVATGKVRQVAPTVDGTTRLGLAYVDLDAGHKASAGMYASGQILLAKMASSVVPEEAIVLRDGRTSVFRLDAKGRVKQVSVETGQRLDNQIAISRGVAVGDVVAVRGAGFLADGDRVKIAKVPAPVASAKEAVQ